MTVKDLINELQHFDEDMQVVLQSGNSNYAEGISFAVKRELAPFRGPDRNVVVIIAGSQCGTIN